MCDIEGRICGEYFVGDSLHVWLKNFKCVAFDATTAFGNWSMNARHLNLVIIIVTAVRGANTLTSIADYHVVDAMPISLPRGLSCIIGKYINLRIWTIEKEIRHVDRNFMKNMGVDEITCATATLILDHVRRYIPFKLSTANVNNHSLLADKFLILMRHLGGIYVYAATCWKNTRKL